MRRWRRLIPALLAVIGVVLMGAVAAPVLAGPVLAGPVVDGVRERGLVRCGVSNGVAGFSNRDDQGQWHGFDVDFCRAVAAAVLGDAGRVVFVPATVQRGLSALARGEIDLLSRTATLTLKRVAEYGLHPVGVTYYDGQTFLLRRASGVRALHQLAGRTICFQSGTTNEERLKEQFEARQIPFIPVAEEDFQRLVQDFRDGRCEALSSESSTLASIAVTALPQGEPYVILRQHISKEPLGPMVRNGDDAWFEITRWTLMALIEAEELGVSRLTVEALRSSDKPQLKRLLGGLPGAGQALGLDDRWVDRVISQVGNYGDIFEANLGAGSALKLDRGLNDLWLRGGLMIALPVR